MANLKTKQLQDANTGEKFYPKTNVESVEGLNELISNDVSEKVEQLESKIVDVQNDINNNSYKNRQFYFDSTVRLATYINKVSIKRGDKIFLWYDVYNGYLEYTFYEDYTGQGTQIATKYRPHGEIDSEFFSRAPVFPSFGAFFRVDESTDLIPFVKGVHEKIKDDSSIDLEKYLILEKRIPSASVVNCGTDYMLHGYLTPAGWGTSSKNGFLWWFWDIDISNESAYCRYVDVSDYTVKNVAKYEGNSPNLYKFYAEYTSKIKSLESRIVSLESNLK